jgi:hypothetical protein
LSYTLASAQEILKTKFLSYEILKKDERRRKPAPSWNQEGQRGVIVFFITPRHASPYSKGSGKKGILYLQSQDAKSE